MTVTDDEDKYHEVGLWPDGTRWCSIFSNGRDSYPMNRPVTVRGGRCHQLDNALYWFWYVHHRSPAQLLVHPEVAAELDAAYLAGRPGTVGFYINAFDGATSVPIVRDADCPIDEVICIEPELTTGEKAANLRRLAAETLERGGAVAQLIHDDAMATADSLA